MEMTIHTVGVYRMAERSRYRQVTPSIVVAFSGFRFFRSLGIELHHPDPFIAILPGEQTVELDCDHRREDWVIVLSSPHLHQALQANQVEIFSHGVWVPVPKVTPVPVERVSGWRMEMERLRDAALTPLPNQLLRIETGVMHLLRFVLDQQRGETSQVTPARQLKRLIDEDERCVSTLGELSLRCHYSADHLRLLFAQEYGLTPHDYRQRRRMAMAMELINNTRLSIREIAEQLGFQYPSHFSLTFTHTFHLTPREAIHRFRHHMSTNGD